MSKTRHYTPLEKKIFLDILKTYKNIIEIKKSNSATLKEKEVAWSKVAEQYNNSQNITQERSIAQLKKLWTNLKQAQRNALTKEKQARIATGGGPEEPSVDIDPDVSEIAPHLMLTAPVIFSSNMEDSEIIEQREIMNLTEVDEEVIYEQEHITIEKEQNIETETANINKIDNTRKRKRNGENDLKIERVAKIMKQEEEMAIIRKENEEKLFQLKLSHIEELHNLNLKHKKQLHEYQLKEAQIKLDLAEHIYSREISKN